MEPLHGHGHGAQAVACPHESLCERGLSGAGRTRDADQDPAALGEQGRDERGEGLGVHGPDAATRVARERKTRPRHDTRGGDSYGGPMRLAVRLLPLVVLLLGTTACLGNRPLPLSGTLTVYASPTYTEVLAELIQTLRTSNPSVAVETLFESDSRLAELASAGPPADVILAEDPATLSAVTATPVRLARGQLVLAVRADNPARINGLASLARPEVRVALCAPDEPCGRVAAEVLTAAQVPTPPTALTEPDVRSALAHVLDGTADVALVYRGDAMAAGEAVATIEVAASATAMAELVGTVGSDAPNRVVADAFLALLSSPTGAEAFTRAGFRPPS
jgi:molybdate transport system substrate-binding protein